MCYSVYCLVTFGNAFDNEFIKYDVMYSKLVPD